MQLGSANAKLLDQFLSPFYNRRDDEFGGSLENRARVLRLIRRGDRRAGGCRLPGDGEGRRPSGRRSGCRARPTAEAFELCRLVEEWGFDAVTPVEVSVLPDTTLSRGGVPDSFWTNPGMTKRFRAASPDRMRRGVIKAGAWWGAKRAPFEPCWNRTCGRGAKQRVGIPVLAVGGIRTADEVNAILDGGEADLVGIGRPFYAEADLAERILGPPRTTTGRLCQNSNRCVPAQMLGMKGVCYNPDVRKRPRELIRRTARSSAARSRAVTGHWARIDSSASARWSTTGSPSTTTSTRSMVPRELERRAVVGARPATTSIGRSSGRRR